MTVDHELRRTYIGGSDAAAIVAGGDEWRKLWAIKTARIESDDLSNILAVQLGIFTETFNLDWYEKQTGRKVWTRGRMCRHEDYHFIGCLLDGATNTSTGEAAPIQAKHVGKAGDQMTLRYTAQCTHEALVTGCDWWVMSTLIGNNKWELTEQEVDPFFAADYLEKCREFWGYVENDQEPPVTEPLPVPPPRRLRVVQLEDFTRDDWPNWGAAMIEEMTTFARTHGAFQAHEISKRNIKELLPDDVGTVLRSRVKVTRDKAGAVRVSLSSKGEP